jgi:hypothetical protein
MKGEQIIWFVTKISEFCPLILIKFMHLNKDIRTRLVHKLKRVPTPIYDQIDKVYGAQTKRVGYT